MRTTIAAAIAALATVGVLAVASPASASDSPYYRCRRVSHGAVSIVVLPSWARPTPYCSPIQRGPVIPNQGHWL